MKTFFPTRNLGRTGSLPGDPADSSSPGAGEAGRQHCASAGLLLWRGVRLGVAVRASGNVNVRDAFPGGKLGGGRGRAVITASSAMEYAFEGDRLADDHSPQPSVFTSALVEGLATEPRPAE